MVYAVRGYFKVSDEFPQHDAGTIWVNVTNVEDGSGTASIDPSSVRAGSKNNLITVVFTGEGTMDGGAVQLTIPEDWGDMQDDPLERNYIAVDVSSGAALSDPASEIVDDGIAVVAYLETFGEDDDGYIYVRRWHWNTRQQRC